MQKLKFFISAENELQALESEINGWLEQSGVKLVSVSGNIAPQTVAPQARAGEALVAFSASDIFVIVVYEESDG